MKLKFPPLKLASVVALSVVIIFSSCQKDNMTNDTLQDEELSPAVEAVQDNNAASDQFSDAFDITQSVSAEDAGEEIGLGTMSAISSNSGNENSFGAGAKCYTVTVVPRIKGEWPKTVTINFGDGCTGKDGKVRKGKIVSIYTKPSFMPGAVVSTTFVGYRVDSFAIAGTHKLINTSNDRGISFKMIVTDGKITNSNTGFWRKHRSEQEFTQLEGWMSTTNPLKNGYRITGSTNGSNSNGRSWKTQTSTPLIRKFDCKWISKGILQIWWNDNKTAATLDYGDGKCDDQAVLTYKDKSKTITLK